MTHSNGASPTSVFSWWLVVFSVEHYSTRYDVCQGLYSENAITGVLQHATFSWRMTQDSRLMITWRVQIPHETISGSIPPHPYHIVSVHDLKLRQATYGTDCEIYLLVSGASQHPRYLSSAISAQHLSCCTFAGND